MALKFKYKGDEKYRYTVFQNGIFCTEKYPHIKNGIFANFISLRDIICSEKVRGKNIIVIADACYSGTLWRGIPSPVNMSDKRTQKSGLVKPGSRGKNSSPVWIIEDRFIASAQKKSRQVIGSGGIETVDDWGKKNHSPFAYHLLDALRNNNDKFTDFEKIIISHVWEQVYKYGQRINIGRFITPADEDGQFVLALKTEEYVASLSEKEQVQTRSGADTPDTLPPDIKVKGWTDKRTVFTDEAFMEISVKDENIIETVTVNNRRIIKKAGRNLYFNHLISLNTGDNTIIIESSDQSGNQSRKEIQIHRKLRKIFDTGVRMPVLMFPLLYTKTRNPVIENMLLGYLAESRRFNMLKEFLPNKNLQSFENLEGLPDQGEILNTAVRLAREKKADFVLTGTVKAGENVLQISVNIIEAESSQVITFQDV